MKFSELRIRIYDDDFDEKVEEQLEKLEEEYKKREELKKQKFNEPIGYDEDGNPMIYQDLDLLNKTDKENDFLKLQEQIRIAQEIKNNLSKELTLEDIYNLPKDFDYVTFEIIDYTIVDEDDDEMDLDFTLVSNDNEIRELKTLINDMDYYSNGNSLLYAVLETDYTDSEYSIDEFDNIIDDLDNYYLTASLRDEVEEYLRYDDVPEELWDYFDFDSYEENLIDDYRYHNTSYGILVNTNN